MHFPPFFHPLSIIFFPNMIFGHIFAIFLGVQPKNIHPCFNHVGRSVWRDGKNVPTKYKQRGKLMSNGSEGPKGEFTFLFT